MKKAAKEASLEELRSQRVSLAACVVGMKGQLPIQEWVVGKIKMPEGSNIQP
jgi:Tfp pilus assembly protein PilO